MTVREFTGEFDGNQRNDDYVITVRYPGSDLRGFVGIAGEKTVLLCWEWSGWPSGRGVGS